ncbi:MAG: hypothetical protein U1F43_13135 [Myxococcota bacterium]
MKRIILSAIALALPALFAWSCTDAGADPTTSGDQNHVISQSPLATETVALSFFASDTTTACGKATGVRVSIAAEGETLTCVAPWAPALISDPYTGAQDQGVHFVADCFFVVAPGTWDVLTVEPIGENGEALQCCTTSYPDTVNVVSGATTEFGVEIQCPLVGPGALDIYGYLERPPIIKDLDIFPSKFGSPCVPRFLWAEASDLDGDMILYSWSVIATPNPDGYKIWDHGQMAIFMAYHTGDYMLRLTVTDVPHGMSTHLDFPIHVTAPAFVPFHGGGSLCGDVEPTIPADFGHAP